MTKDANDNVAKILSNIWLLAKEKLEPDEAKVHQVTDRSNIQLYGGDQNAIDDKWYKVPEKKPWTHKGPTIRLAGWHTLYDDGKDDEKDKKDKKKKKFILEVIPSDYKEAYLLGYLGVATIPITQDSCIVLQDSCKQKHTYSGLGVPGCTPIDTDVLPQVIREMYEEFGVSGIRKSDLKVLGLIQVKPPAGPMPNHCLVVKVEYPGTFAKLEASWKKNVKDDKKMNEGEPVKLTLNKELKKINSEKERKVEYPSLLALLMVLDSELSEEEKFLDHTWFKQIEYKFDNLKPNI